MKPWNTPTLNKGETILETIGDCHLSIDHVDRTLDPYLAGVIWHDVIVYTGLHATLADARQKCEAKAYEAL